MNTIDMREARFTVQDGIAEFSHQRAERRNPLSKALLADYRDLVAAVECDASIRALIITGSGGCFCAGGDVRDMAARAEHGDPSGQPIPQAVHKRLLGEHRQWIERFRMLEVPVIAAIDGLAFGAGVSLALLSDFVFASTSAKFSFVFARIGLLPDLGAMYTLPRIVGVTKAKELMMTARAFDAEEAKELGIVHSIYDPEVLLTEAHKFASRLAKGPREALGIIKTTLNRSLDVDYQTMVEIEASQQPIAIAAPFHTEAVLRFARKEPPMYDWGRL